VAEPLKAIYSEKFFTTYLKDVKQLLPNLKVELFLEQIFSEDWEQKELKQRMTHIAFVLRNLLDPSYPKAIQQIIDLIQIHRSDKSNGFNFECMFYPEFVTNFGLDDFETSIHAIEQITQFTSCEFTVRHFLNTYPEQMIAQMQAWSKHPHAYIRRLSSEGMRTKLPWAIKVPYLQENPTLIHPILEYLVNDESEWVRKSVANNLNDLSKDFPDFVKNFTKKWLNHSDEVNKVLKHACRTMLKKGDEECLKLFGVGYNDSIQLIGFNLQTPKIKIGESLIFDFELENKDSQDILVRIEYVIYFLRNKLAHYPKVFKISEKNINSTSIIKMQKVHSFKEITTRKFYKGEHFISLTINGVSYEKVAFDLN
jgi:3-methyladenine DNA glycosylase AlkC